MLLFDQNISFRVVKKLLDLFPDSIQVRKASLENKNDIEIWEYAKKHHLSIVTFDSDFYDISTLNGVPPKIIWLRFGNTTSDKLEHVLREYKDAIFDFIHSEKYAETACLELHFHST